MKRIIESIREYIDTFESLKKITDLNIEYRPTNEIHYLVEEIPMEMDGIINEDIVGNTTRVYQFALITMFKYDERIKSDIENSAFFDDFQEWVEQNNKNKILPVLEDDRLSSMKIETLTTPYLIWDEVAMSKAKYMVKCQLIYEKENI